MPEEYPGKREVAYRRCHAQRSPPIRLSAEIDIVLQEQLNNRGMALSVFKEQGSALYHGSPCIVDAGTCSKRIIMFARWSFLDVIMLRYMLLLSSSIDVGTVHWKQLNDVQS